MKTSKLGLTAILVAVAALVAFAPGTANAHCDTMAGPVVSAARQALDTGNINLVLIWVQPNDEAAIRAEFDKARAARQIGGKTKDDADMRFFEALVRIHRAGEGAPYTGIKPAGTDIGIAVPAADRALESGSVAELQKLVGDAVLGGVARHFQEALDQRRYDPNDVAAGRAFVKAYVEYTHYLEGVYETATTAGHHAHGAAEGYEGEHAAAHQGQAGHEGHGGHEGHLPWILVGILGLACVGEAGWIIVCRKRS
jgi:hypothetical protein